MMVPQTLGDLCLKHREAARLPQWDSETQKTRSFHSIGTTMKKTQVVCCDEAFSLRLVCFRHCCFM